MRVLWVGVLLILVVSACSSPASQTSPGDALVASLRPLGVSCGQPVVGEPDNMPQWLCQGVMRGVAVDVVPEADSVSVADVVAQVPAATDADGAKAVFGDLVSSMNAFVEARSQLVSWIGQWDGAQGQVSTDFAGGRATIESDATWIGLYVSRVPFLIASTAPTPSEPMRYDRNRPTPVALTTIPAVGHSPQVICDSGSGDCARAIDAVLEAVADVDKPVIRIHLRADAMCIWYPFTSGAHSCPAIIMPDGTRLVSSAVVTFAGTDQQAFLNLFWLADDSVSPSMALVAPPSGTTPFQ